MIIGKWNKSVILSYVGLSISMLGILLICRGVDIKYAEICLIVAGICDLFDGTIARRCKRTKEEKLFGIELDSLIDVFNFIAFPIIILISLGLYDWIALPCYILYAVFGIARLAHFNITTEDTNKAREYYEGLPVTYAALIFPLVYLLRYVLEGKTFLIIYLLTMFVVSILFIVKVDIPKPKLKTSLILVLIAIAVITVYLTIV